MNLDFLQKSSFWYLFSIIIIVALFLYGLQLDTNKSKLQKAEEQLVKASSTIQLLNTKLLNLNNEKAKLQNSLEQKKERIKNLNGKITFLENIPPDTVVEYIYQTIYKDKPEKYHTYGKRKGKLVIYKTCSNCQNMKVWVDGVEQGTLTDYYDDGAPSCYASGSISLIVDAGSHHIECKDKHGATWEIYVKVKEDECFKQGFRKG